MEVPLPALEPLAVDAGLAIFSFLHRCGLSETVYILRIDPPPIFIQATLSGLSGFKNTAHELAAKSDGMIREMIREKVLGDIFNKIHTYG